METNAVTDAEPLTGLPAVPVARKSQVRSELHGEERVDDYFWLREKANPDVAAYLEAENAYADAVMKPTEALQEALYKEMLARIQETDLSVPAKDGAYWYYARTEEGKQYPILCRRKGPDGPEEIILDENVLAEGLKFFSLGAFVITDDGRYLAYTTDVTGFRDYTLYLKDLHDGALLPFKVEKAGSLAWAADNADALLHHRRCGQAAVSRLPPPPRRGRGRAGLRRGRRAVPHLRGPHAQPRVRAARVRQPHHDGVAVPARGEADGRVPHRRPPRARARVRRRPPRRLVLHPHQRPGTELPAGEGEGGRARGARAGWRSCPTAPTRCWKASRSSGITTCCSTARRDWSSCGSPSSRPGRRTSSLFPSPRTPSSRWATASSTPRCCASATSRW